jgi:hypothetical protein
MRWDTPLAKWDSGQVWDRPSFPIGEGVKSMIFKLIITFAKLSFGEFLAKAQRIKVALTSEPALTLFPDPWPATYPSRAQLVAAYTAYETAYDAAGDGGKTARDARDQKRRDLEKVLRDVAPYFEVVAKAANDITVLDATGYDRRQPPVPAPNPLPAPGLKLSRNGMSGLLVASADRIRGGDSYEAQLCTGDPANEENWKHAVTSTRCRDIQLTGLTPGRLYYVRLRAVGGRGPGAWSDIAQMMAT